MKRTGNYYDVCSPDSTHRIMIRRNDSFDAVVESLNDAVEHAKAAGFNNDEKWLIVKVKWEKTFDEQGIFRHEATSRTTEAIYDNGTVIKI